MADITAVEQGSESPFNEPQFEAARFLVARLRAEAAGEKFEGEEIGIKFVPMGDFPAASVDTGIVITATDFIRASLLILWSMVLDMSEAAGCSPNQVIQSMGLSLAEHDPQHTA